MFKTAAAAMFIVSATFVGMGAYPTPSVDDTPIVVNEDDPGWNCATMGNRVCGPTNVDHMEAGCYNDNEEMIAPWPCFVVVWQRGRVHGCECSEMERMMVLHTYAQRDMMYA